MYNSNRLSKNPNQYKQKSLFFNNEEDSDIDEEGLTTKCCKQIKMEGILPFGFLGPLPSTSYGGTDQPVKDNIKRMHQVVAEEVNRKDVLGINGDINVISTKSQNSDEPFPMDDSSSSSSDDSDIGEDDFTRKCCKKKKMDVILPLGFLDPLTSPLPSPSQNQSFRSEESNFGSNTFDDRDKFSVSMDQLVKGKVTNTKRKQQVVAEEVNRRDGLSINDNNNVTSTKTQNANNSILREGSTSSSCSDDSDIGDDDLTRKCFKKKKMEVDPPLGFLDPLPLPLPSRSQNCNFPSEESNLRATNNSNGSDKSSVKSSRDGRGCAVRRDDNACKLTRPDPAPQYRHISTSATASKASKGREKGKASSSKTIEGYSISPTFGEPINEARKIINRNKDDERSVLEPHCFSSEYFKDINLWSLLEYQGWTTFLSEKLDVKPKLVQWFNKYVEFSFGRDRKGEKPQMFVKCEKLFAKFGRKSFRNHFELPCEGFCDYNVGVWPREFATAPDKVGTYEELMDYLNLNKQYMKAGKEGVGWKPCLRAEDKFLFKIIRSSLIPSGSNDLGLTKLECVMLYMIKQRIKVNLPSLMIQHIASYITKTSAKNFPLGNLVTC